MKRYILQGHKAVPVDREPYLNQEEHQDRTVAKSTIGNYLVSTVFLGLDHQWDAHGPPLLFETMVFGKGEFDERQERCTTWEEAESMHEKMCEEVRQQVSHDQDGLPTLDNSKLINAAPDLLQALERAVALIAWELEHDVTDQWPNVSGVKQDIEKSARAAIDKATGEQQ